MALGTGETKDAGARPATDADGRALVRPQPPALTVSNGSQAVAPAGGAVLADTGPLAAGDYLIEIEAGSADTLAAGKGIRIEHRNAANAANIVQGAVIPAGAYASIRWGRVTLATNERVRATVAGVAGAASSEYGAHIRAYKINSVP
jgi:hypothetical protein